MVKQIHIVSEMFRDAIKTKVSVRPISTPLSAKEGSNLAVNPRLTLLSKRDLIYYLKENLVQLNELILS